MEDRLKEALKLRFEYYNLYEGKENKWHDKYKEYPLYDIVVKSFDYDFKEISKVMPELLNKKVGESL